MSQPHIIRNIERPGKELVKRFLGQATATIHEAMERQGAMSSKIKPILEGMRICGPAVTVRCQVGDNLMLLKAIYVALPGDILVVDAGEFNEQGQWGEITSLASQIRGIGGIVTNGAVRDGIAIKAMGFPVFSVGLSVKGTVKESLGSINQPITCGGITVHPGDIILGDDDGVVVIPLMQAPEIMKKALEREEKEALTMGLLREGRSLLEIYGFDKVLLRKGCLEQENQ